MYIYNKLYINKLKYLFKIIKNNVCLFGKKLYLCTVVVWISVVLTSLETQLVLSRNPHHSMVRIFCDYRSLLTVYSLQMIGKAYCINFSTALPGSALKVPAGRLAMIAFIESA